MHPAPPVIRILFPIVIEPCTTVSPQYATSPIQQLGSSPLLFTGPCLESRLQPASLCKPPCRSKTSQASLVISFSPQRGEGRVRGEKVRSALSPSPHWTDLTCGLYVTLHGHKLLARIPKEKAQRSPQYSRRHHRRR